LGKANLAEEDMNLALRWMKESDSRRKDAERWLKEFEK
jgi:hypothetical protein